MEGQYQYISNAQWNAIKATVSALNESEAASGLPLPDEWRDLADHWQKLLVQSTGKVEPFAVTEHFLWLLQVFLDGAQEQDTVAEGSRLVMDWAQEAIATGASFGLEPTQDSDKTIWLVMGVNPP